MSVLNNKVGPFSAFQLIGILGAILVIVAFFLSWVDISGSVLGFERTEGITGMEFFDGEYVQDKDAWQNMIPLITLILAVIALIISVVPGEYLGGAKTEGALGVVSIIISIALIIVTILFMTWIETGSVDFGFGQGSVKYGIGAYLCLVGSILVFIVGILPLFKSTA